MRVGGPSHLTLPLDSFVHSTAAPGQLTTVGLTAKAGILEGRRSSRTCDTLSIVSEHP